MGATLNHVYFYSCQTQNNLDLSSSAAAAIGVAASKLSERDKKQASIPIAVFGLSMVCRYVK